MSVLDGVEVLVFDVFGTTVNWRGSVVEELQELGKKHSLSYTTEDWTNFANEWREEFKTVTRRVAGGGSGPSNVDVMHREILDCMLDSAKWSDVGSALDDDASRTHLNLVWHRLKGWPDTVSGLYDLKKQTLVTCLSNGNTRLLIDLAKHANLPWDAVFSCAMFNSYKPNPAVYTGALAHLSLSDTPQKAAMVAAHLFDLQGAAKVGMKTVYVPRPEEEWDGIPPEDIKSKAEGGEVNLVVKDFEELARLLAKRK